MHLSPAVSKARRGSAHSWHILNDHLETTMNITAELSLYPHYRAITCRLSKPILMHSMTIDGLEVRTHALSTEVFGEYSARDASHSKCLNAIPFSAPSLPPCWSRNMSSTVIAALTK